jgi:hypothetical protein
MDIEEFAHLPGSPDVLIRVEGKDNVIRADAGMLQAVLDKAWRHFRDPTKPETGPIPDRCFEWNSASHLGSAPQTGRGTGQRKRGR